jgi:transcription termination factor Rho
MTVLQRKELESSPLADLHAIASELGLEGYRRLRKAQLVDAILGSEGGNGAAASDEEAPAEVEADAEPAVSEDEQEPDEVPADEALETPTRRRRRRGGRGRRGAAEEPAVEEPAAEDEQSEGEQSEGEQSEGEQSEGEGEADVVEEEPEVVEDEISDERLVTGVLDVLPNGSGFVRSDEEEAYISPAQIRRCELRAGDEVSGPVRPPRRNERHASLIRVDAVNGREAEPPEERPRFEDLVPVFPSKRLKAPALLDAVPLGRGSRVAVAGPPGAGATTLLRELAASLAKEKAIDVYVVLAGVRPEEVAEWREAAGGAVVSGGSFESSPESLGQAAELAVERAKRRVERGEDAAVLIDSLAGLPPAVSRRVFGAARATEGGPSLTVVAAVGEAVEPLRWATSWVKFAAPEPGATAPAIDAAASGTLRADRL